MLWLLVSSSFSAQRSVSAARYSYCAENSQENDKNIGVVKPYSLPPVIPMFAHLLTCNFRSRHFHSKPLVRLLMPSESQLDTTRHDTMLGHDTTSVAGLTHGTLMLCILFFPLTDINLVGLFVGLTFIHLITHP
jgi:hypothetical protein